jgi:hypothetical protein
MPDVGLFTATEPVSKELPVIIRYSVEVGGLPVYNESYDVAKLAEEIESDPAKAHALWLRRLTAPVEARNRPGFSASLTRCLADGKCCDYGRENCIAVDELCEPA